MRSLVRLAQRLFAIGGLALWTVWEIAKATTQVARALIDHLPARGAGCVMESEQLCLAIPGDKHDDSRVLTSAFLGEFKERADLRARLMAAVGRAGRG